VALWSCWPALQDSNSRAAPAALPTLVPEVRQTWLQWELSITSLMSGAH